MIIDKSDVSYSYKVWVINWRGKNPYRSLDLKNLINSYSNALVICAKLIDPKRLNECYTKVGFNLFRVWDVSNDPFYSTWEKVGGIFRLTMDLHRELVSKYMLFGVECKSNLIKVLQEEFLGEIRILAKSDEFDKDYMELQESRNRNQLLYLKPERYKDIAEKYWTLGENLTNRVFVSGEWRDLIDPFILKKSISEEENKNGRTKR